MELEKLLDFCSEQGASDLHLSAGHPPWLRVDGELRAAALPALSNDQVLACIESCLEPAQRKRYRAGSEVDMAIDRAGLGRFRLNAFLQNRGCAAVFRAIPAQVPSLAQLGMDGAFAGIAELPRGLVVVTGPTGSGKSSTLAAMVDHVNRNRSGHILTIEDPIEFVHDSKRCLVSQREANLHTKGLRHRFAGRPARGSGPDPAGRTARHGYYPPGPDRRGNGTPGVGHIAHGVRNQDGQPHR